MDKKILNAVCDKAREQLSVWEVPGLPLGVAKDGEVVFTGGIGVRNAAGDSPDGKTLFQIGSCSKAFTAAAAMILKDRGVLDLDAPVVKYLPDFKLMDDYASKHVTTRDLLCHRSGVPRHEYAWYGADFTREQLVYNLRYHQANIGLREGFQYNNIGFVLVGWLIEKLTGKTWEQFVEDELFKPLGMSRTTCFIDAMLEDGNYMEIFDHVPSNSMKGRRSIPFYRTPVESYEKKIGAPFGPAGSIISCAEDMLKWGMFHLGDGTAADGTRILSPESMNELHRAHSICVGDELPDGRQNICYGLGWRTYSYHGRRILTHSGGIDGSTTEFYVVPAEKLVVVTNVNMYPNLFCDAVAMDVVDKVLGVESDQYDAQYKAMEGMFRQQDELAAQMRGEPVEGTSMSHKLEEYAGVYHMDGYNDITITVADGAMKLNFIGTDVPVSHFHYDVFRLDGHFGEMPDGLTMQFAYNSAGCIDRMYIPMVLEPGMEPLCFRKVD